jgi:hypothetical protein
VDLDLADEDWITGSFIVHNRPDSPGTTGYELGYQYDELDYDPLEDDPNTAPDESLDPQTVKWASAWLQIITRLPSDLELSLLGGLESDIREPDSASLDEGRWEVGLAADLQEDQVSAGVGHRYFGTTYRFDWTHTADDRSYWISYDETPSTTDYRDLRYLNPAAPSEPGAPPPPPDSGLEEPGRADVSIVKRFDAGTAWTRYRSRLAWSVFWEEQEDVPLASESGEQQEPDETSVGTALDFSWDVGVRTTASLGASFTRRDFGGGNDSDDELRASADLTHELGVRTSLGFGVGLQTRDSDGTADYDEYYARVELTRRFY